MDFRLMTTGTLPLVLSGTILGCMYGFARTEGVMAPGGKWPSIHGLARQVTCTCTEEAPP